MIYRRQRTKMTSVLVGAALLIHVQGCGEDWAPKLAFGTAIPDARLHVWLSEPVPSLDLIHHLDQTMRAAGYPLRWGEDPQTLDQPQTKAARHGWEWTNTSGDSDYSISIMWDETGTAPVEFDFIFLNAGTDPFTEIEWLLFFEWKEDRLPAAFPDATIAVTRHPTEKTDFVDLIAISDATGIAIPDKVKRRFDEWNATIP